MRTLKGLVALLAVGLLAGPMATRADVVPYGIQANVTAAQIASWGWTECHRSPLNAATAYTTSSAISGCTGDYLAMGAWDASLGAYGVVGMGEYNVVTAITYFDYTGDDSGTAQNWSNGLNWYRTSNSGSWGFTTSGQTALFSADINLLNGLQSEDSVGTVETDLAKGLSFHVYSAGVFGDGWAYNPDGNSFSNIYSPGDERVFWTAAVPAPVPLPAAAWLLLSGLGGLGFMARRRKAA